MSTTTGKNKGTGHGWAATLKDAIPDREVIEVTMFGEADCVYIPGRIRGWHLPDGTYLAAKDAARRGIR